MSWYSSKATNQITRAPGFWGWFTSWIQSLDFVTQSAHVGWGGFVTALASHFMPWWLAAILFLGLWCIPKELVFDKVSWGEGHGTADWVDLLFYTLGVGIACFTLWVKG